MQKKNINNNLKVKCHVNNEGVCKLKNKSPLVGKRILVLRLLLSATPFFISSLSYASSKITAHQRKTTFCFILLAKEERNRIEENKNINLSYAALFFFFSIFVPIAAGFIIPFGWICESRMAHKNDEGWCSLQAPLMKREERRRKYE